MAALLYESSSAYKHDKTVFEEKNWHQAIRKVSKMILLTKGWANI